MAKNEIKYLRMIEHPNVIRLFDSEIDDITQKAYMLLDWLPVGALILCIIILTDSPLEWNFARDDR